MKQNPQLGFCDPSQAHLCCCSSGTSQGQPLAAGNHAKKIPGLTKPNGAGGVHPLPSPSVICPWKMLGGGWQKLYFDNKNETNMCTQLFSLPGVRVVLLEG